MSAVKKSNTTTFPKRIKYPIIAVCIILAIPLAIILVLRICYTDFYKNAAREFEIPALSENFVPQGLAYDGESGLYFISGYSSADNTAKICALRPDGEYNIVNITDGQGKPFECHCGGIALGEELVYIAGCDGSCYVMPKAPLYDGNKDEVALAGSFEAFNAASYCYIHNGYLYIGEYHYPVKFTTEASHRIVTLNDEENNAIITVFALRAEEPHGVAALPEKVYSVPSRIQGMCLTEDAEVMIFSASSVFRGSQLYFYDVKAAECHDESFFEINSDKVPLYCFDSQCLNKSVEILPKSEGIVVCGDRLYMIFESASNKFFYGKFLGCQYAYSLPLEDLPDGM